MRSILDETIFSLVEKKTKEQERLIKEAFQEHFGFPIEQVDKSKLDRATVIGQRMERFRYNGEAFLLWEEPQTVEQKNSPNCCELTMTATYLKV